MMAKRDYYEIQDGKVIRKKKHCPKCGEGVFLGEHKDRVTCGSCGYTEFKKAPQPEPEGERGVVNEPGKGREPV
jgi:small subunit ribosomal protein S27Ae